MTINVESANLALRLWFMIHHTHDLLKLCEDRVFSNYKLTTEQYVILVTIKYGLVRPTDIARWLARSPNSVSMIADRMVKAGLLKRVRDRRDRRVVRLIITDKAENALKPAYLAGWDFSREIMSPLSYEDRQTFLNLLLMIQDETHKYLNPEADTEEMRRNEGELHAKLLTWLNQYIPPSTLKAKQGGDKGKPI